MTNIDPEHETCSKCDGEGRIRSVRIIRLKPEEKALYERLDKRTERLHKILALVVLGTVLTVLFVAIFCPFIMDFVNSTETYVAILATSVGLTLVSCLCLERVEQLTGYDKYLKELKERYRFENALWYEFETEAR